jgi:hypothetical protein
LLFFTSEGDRLAISPAGVRKAAGYANCRALRFFNFARQRTVDASVDVTDAR